jgi:methylmalonyl-CoA/ethylmalonyl-CoA epimerase
VETAPFFFAILNIMETQVSLNHIGIATATGNTQLEKLFKILNITRGPSERVPDQGVNVHFFNMNGTPPHLELLQVEDPNGTVAKFIEKRGAGIHHLSFLVEQGGLKSLCSELEREGFKLIYPEPKPGAQNMLINFIHPGTAGGVLIELMEGSHAHESE